MVWAVARAAVAREAVAMVVAKAAAEKAVVARKATRAVARAVAVKVVVREEVEEAEAWVAALRPRSPNCAASSTAWYRKGESTQVAWEARVKEESDADVCGR